MNAPELISVDDARAIVIAAVRPLGSESVELRRALGRVLAEDIRSDTDRPPFASSAMDGFAVVAGPERTLAIVGEARAGHPADRRLGDGEAIRISTGAPIPDGADAVVPIERVDATPTEVRVPATERGAHLRAAGEDIAAGTEVLRPGTELGPAALAVAASLGRTELSCGARPRVAVLVTGDELVPAGEPLGFGQIHDSNTTALAAQAERAGAQVVVSRVVHDELDETAAAIGGALDEADVVCISGGVSVGPHDHVKDALARLGVEQRFWRVRLKPGKPAWFGVRDATLVFGLPGNPVSAMVTFQLFARPALRLLQGGDPHARRAVAVLDRPVQLNADRDQAIRCSLSVGAEGWRATPAPHQGSHVLTSMLSADALALAPAGDGELPAGARVDIELLA